CIKIGAAKGILSHLPQRRRRPIAGGDRPDGSLRRSIQGELLGASLEGRLSKSSSDRLAQLITPSLSLSWSRLLQYAQQLCDGADVRLIARERPGLAFAFVVNQRASTQSIWDLLLSGKAKLCPTDRMQWVR